MALGIKRRTEGEGEYDPTPNPHDLEEAMNLRAKQPLLRPRHFLALAKAIAEESTTGSDRDANGEIINGKGIESLPLLFASGQIPQEDQMEILRHHHRSRLQQKGQEMTDQERQQTENRIAHFSEGLRRLRSEKKPRLFGR